MRRTLLTNLGLPVLAAPATAKRAGRRHVLRQGTRESPTTISSPFTQDGPVSTDVISVDADHEAYALDVSLVRFSFVQPGTRSATCSGICSAPWAEPRFVTKAQRPVHAGRHGA